MFVGYDKLKPFGFPIHGAIDGYSRKILWLEVSRSNNKPEVPATYFLSCVKEQRGCPCLVRTDCGTENGTMAAMQCYFRQDDNDELAGMNAHKYGSSPSNQRIECWWSFLRRGRTSWWIDLFKEMVNSELLDLGNMLHTECLWFCFQGVLQEDLDEVRLHWNTHRIRYSRHGTVPGVPDVLYHVPEQSGGFECKVSLSRETIHEVELHVHIDDDDDDDLEDERRTYQDYFHYVMESEDFIYPETHEEAYALFFNLIGIATR